MSKWSRIIPLVVVILTALVYASVDDELIFGDSFESLDPVIITLPVISGRVDELYSYDVDATDPKGDTLLYLLTTFPEGMSMNASSGLITWTPLASGDFPVEIDVSNSLGKSAGQTWMITVEEAFDSDNDGLSDVREAIHGTDPNDPDSDDDGLNDGDEVFTEGSDPLDPDTDSDGLEDGVEVANHGTIPIDPDTDGDFYGDGMEIIAGTDPLDENDFPAGPPDPVVIAPPVDPSVTTTLFESTAFLYSGDPLIQTGVLEGTIDPRRAAVLRGYVMTRGGAPLPGAVVTINDHPEYGQTISRADGMYDMVVNGGGPLTVDFVAPATLPGQRLVQVEWQTYHSIPDMALVPLDAQVTAVDLDAAVEMQVAQGSPVTDADGTRQATVLFPQGTTAMMRMPDDTLVPISNLNVRATEYTVGDNGPAAMPGKLPPNSAYTYAVELSIDEAMQAGAETVEFNNPIPFYVDNFLGFPAGIDVPSGYYDREKATWVASDNGLVIEVLDITGGLAELDIDGSGTAADTGELAALGITDAEREQMAALYAISESFWRVPIKHFSSWDSNWGFSPPNDATPPWQGEFHRDYQDYGSSTCSEQVPGSIIQCQSQTMGQSVPITGTPHTLNYHTARTPGNLAANTVTVSLSSESVPASLEGISLRIFVGGQVYTYDYPPDINQFESFTWNGKDVYGRNLQGAQQFSAEIGYVYQGVYEQVERFGYRGNGTEIVGDFTRDELTLPEHYHTLLTSWDARGQGLGGWSLDYHHAYDVNNQTLYFGYGGKTNVNTLGNVISAYAGTGVQGYGGDGGPASEAIFDRLYGMTAAPDGSVYIADLENHRVRHVDLNGIVTTVAGTGEQGYNGDNIPATEARLIWPRGVAIGPDGSLYIAEDGGGRIRRVDSEGIITTVAGTGVSGYDGDGGPATESQISGPEKIAFGPGGDLYIADSENERIRRVDSEGVITTVAGTGTAGYNGDGILAINAQLNDPSGVALDAQGNLYISDSINARIRRVGSNGIITTFAGTGDRGFNGDGLPATEALLGQPAGLAFDSEGNLYIADDHNHRIRLVGTDGMLTTIAGSGPVGEVGVGESSGDENPANRGRINRPEDVSVGPDGRVFIADWLGYRVRVVSPALPGFSNTDILVPSTDGLELYRFDKLGRHLQTLHTLTGSVLQEFTYNSSGELIQAQDGDGNITTIQRDGEGKPTAIVSPFGQVTTLTVNDNGFLKTITNPAGEQLQMVSMTNGLMTSKTNPRGRISAYGYDEVGRLVSSADNAGNSQSFVRTEIPSGFEVTRTTGLARSVTYHVEKDPQIDEEQLITAPDGAQTTTQNSVALGTLNLTRETGMTTSSEFGPDPRFGMQAPITEKFVLTRPSNAAVTVERSLGAELVNSNDPLSLVSLTESETIGENTFSSVYTSADRTFVLSTQEGRSDSRSINLLGRVTTQQDAGLNEMTFTYDSRGFPETITFGSGPDARLYSFVHNAESYLESITDPLGRTRSYVYDAVGRVTSTTYPDGRSLSYEYDANGNLTSVTPPGRPAHILTYTKRDQLASIVPSDEANSGSTTYQYDAEEQLTWLQRPDDRSVEFDYDVAGRLTERTHRSGDITTSNTSISYDGLGRIGTIATDDVTTLYTYDGAAILSESWFGDINGSVNRSYDGSFRPASQSVNGGNVVAYSYDGDDLLIQAGELFLNREEASGFRTGSSLGAVATSMAIDGFGDLETYEASFSGSPIYSVAYTYNAIGNIEQLTETIEGETITYVFEYDLAGRLKQVQKDMVVVEQYDFDTHGNRTQATAYGETVQAVYDSLDRLQNYGTTIYAHNANGDVTSQTTGPDTKSFQANELGFLEGVTLPNGTDISYVNDGIRRRVGKKMDGIMVREFLYGDELRIVAELDGAGQLVSRFVFADTSTPVYMVRDGISYRFLTDHRGSVRLVINATTGAIAQRLDYDSFGNVLNDTNPGFQPFGFAGGIYDADTGLVRFGAREYDSRTGRWLTKDPAWFAGLDTNLYRYALGDPINHVDRTGMPPNSLKDAFDEITEFDFDPQNPETQKSLLDPKQLKELEAEGRAVQKQQGHAKRWAREKYRPFGASRPIPGKDALGRELDCFIKTGKNAVKGVLGAFGAVLSHIELIKLAIDAAINDREVTLKDLCNAINPLPTCGAFFYEMSVREGLPMS